jgi:hypothetical protein
VNDDPREREFQFRPSSEGSGFFGHF